MQTASTANSCYSLAQVSGATAIPYKGGVAGIVNSSTVSNSAFIRTSAINDGLDVFSNGTGDNIGYFANAADNVSITSGTFSGNLLALLRSNGNTAYWNAATGTENNGYPVLNAIR